MIRILSKIGILFAIVVIASILVHKLVLPFAWGDDSQYTKIQYFEKNHQKYNSLIIGGSLEYRQLNPEIIDSIAQSKGIDMRTFNMAIDGHNFVQQMNDMDYYLDKWGNSLDYIIVSLSSESMFLKNQLHQIKFVQWVNLKSTILGTKINLEAPMPLKRQVQFSYFYGMTFIENGLLFGLGDEASRFVAYDKYNRDYAYLGKNKDGYFPYDLEETHDFLDNQWEEKLLKLSRENYLKQKPERDSLIAINTRQFEGNTKDRKLIKSQLDKLLSIKEKAEKMGIKVYISVPPRTRTSYAILMAIYDKLPVDSKFELADPRIYPEFYAVENGYNFHHLNVKGAALYSKAFADKLVELEKKKKTNQN